MPESTSRPFVPKNSGEIDIESIITAPLVAASKANVVMATGQQRFILDYCFTKTDDGTHEPILIKMVMVKGVVDPDKQEGEAGHLKKVDLVFSLPLLCIVPFSSLAITSLTIDFDLDLTTATSSETTRSKEGKIIDRKAQLKGRISSSSDDNFGDSTKNNSRSQKSSSLRVSLTAGSLPLPNGLLTILDMYTKAIQPTGIDDEGERDA